jgi:hypothetical protein
MNQKKSTSKTSPSKRTLKQNNALHLWFEFLAAALNDAGLDMRAVLKPGVDIPWTSESVKEQLWRPIQVAMLQKKSTTERERPEVSQVEEVLVRHLVKKFGQFFNPPDFPSIEQLVDNKGVEKDK